MLVLGENTQLLIELVNFMVLVELEVYMLKKVYLKTESRLLLRHTVYACIVFKLSSLLHTYNRNSISKTEQKRKKKYKGKSN